MNNSEKKIRIFIRDGIVESVMKTSSVPADVTVEIFDVDTDRDNTEEYEKEMNNEEYSEFDNWIIDHCEE